MSLPFLIFVYPSLLLFLLGKNLIILKKHQGIIRTYLGPTIYNKVIRKFSNGILVEGKLKFKMKCLKLILDLSTVFHKAYSLHIVLIYTYRFTIKILHNGLHSLLLLSSVVEYLYCI